MAVSTGDLLPAAQTSVGQWLWILRACPPSAVCLDPQKKIRPAREYCTGWAGCLATRGRVRCCVQILALACLRQLAKDGSLAHDITSWQTGLAVADAAHLLRLEPNALAQSARPHSHMQVS